MAMNELSRRRFLQTTALGVGALAPVPLQGISRTRPGALPRLPREVMIASFGQHQMDNPGPDAMMERVLKEIDRIAYHEPDIICLPETFLFTNTHQDRPSLSEETEWMETEVFPRFAAYALKHSCYVICPVHTFRDGQYYNAAMVFDREGRTMGEYHKIHPTEGEVSRGLTPGSLDPPVFRTDFGIIGIQICFDINWQDGWEALRKKGAEIIFWPSAFGGGQQVNTKAWLNKCCTVSSTNYGVSKICDVDGSEVATTGHWSEHWAIGTLNLEKAFLHTWPYVRSFPDIEKKYGRKIRIRNHHEEEWSIIESLSPDVRVADILAEFDLLTHEQHIASAEAMQIAHRSR